MSVDLEELERTYRSHGAGVPEAVAIADALRLARFIESKGGLRAYVEACSGLGFDDTEEYQDLPRWA